MAVLQTFRQRSDDMRTPPDFGAFLVMFKGRHFDRCVIQFCVRWYLAYGLLKDWSRCALKPIRIRNSKYLNNRIEQDHRRIKHRMRPMLGFKSFSSAAVTLAGIEMVHMM